MKCLHIKKDLNSQEDGGLESEYMACIADGMSPTEALEEWDLLPPETEEERE